MKLLRKVGVTSEIWQIFIRDSSSTTGAGLTGLLFNSGSLTAYYHRDVDTTATAISLVTMTVGTFTSSGFKEVDSTNMPGVYQFCPPNAALATGAKSCFVMLKGAANMAPLVIEVDLAGNTLADIDTIKTQTVTCAASVTIGAFVGNATAALAVDASGRVDLGKILGTASAGAVGYVGVDWSALTNKTATVALSNTTVGLVTTTTTVTNQLTAAQIATGVWQDSVSSDFTVASSIGKSLGGSFTSLGVSVFSVASLANAPTGGSAPTVGQIATAVWQDLTSGGDFGTAGSVGALIKADINAPIGSIPTNPYTGTPPTTVQIAAAVWQDTTAGDFALTGSIGKSLGSAFTALGSSIFTVAALANAPGGGGGSVTVAGYATGQDPATLVLGAVAASWNTAGTIGQKINAAGGNADPLTNPVPGNYAGGTAGYVLGHLDPTDVTVQLPVDPSGNVVVRIGCDYLLATGNELPFDSTGVWPDLTGATIALELWQPSSDTALYSFPGVVLTPTGDQQVYFELTHTQTSTITAGQYSYLVRATLATPSGKINPLAFGVALIVRP